MRISWRWCLLLLAGCDGVGAPSDSATPTPPPSTSILDYQSLMPIGTVCDGVSDSSVAIGCALSDAEEWTERRLSFPNDGRCIIASGFRDAMDGEFCALYPTSTHCKDIDPIEIGSTCGREVAHPSQLLAMRNLTGSEEEPFIILGNGATLQAEDSLPATAGYGLLLLDAVSFVQISDLTFDGRRDKRIAAETIENAHNIYVASSTDVTLRDVQTLNAVADGYYVGGGHEDAALFSQRVVAHDLIADNSARNNASIINASNCGIYGGQLTNAGITGIDLEPDYGSVEPGIVDFTLSGVTVSDNAGRCIQLSPKGAPQGTVIENNTISRCAHSASECGTAIVIGHPATIRGNLIEDFDLSCRGLVDSIASETSADVVFSENTISDIRHDGENTEAIFYIHSINGGGHTITDNILQSVSAAANGGWCNDQISDSTVLVQDNTIDGSLQDPNPGCAYY